MSLYEFCSAQIQFTFPAKICFNFLVFHNNVDRNGSCWEGVWSTQTENTYWRQRSVGAMILSPTVSILWLKS